MIRPCEKFQPGKTYGSYCRRCHFSIEAHEHWDEWSAAVQSNHRAVAPLKLDEVGGDPF